MCSTLTENSTNSQSFGPEALVPWSGNSLLSIRNFVLGVEYSLWKWPLRSLPEKLNLYRDSSLSGLRDSMSRHEPCLLGSV